MTRLKLEDRPLVLLLCVIAAIRVFVFAAAFPFFNNVDEGWHFDLVVKYSHGHVPHNLELISKESADDFARFGAPEYLLKPEQFAGGKFPSPAWTQPPEAVSAAVAAATATFQSITNHEAENPPLYYALAGSWLQLGRWCDLKGAFLLYWIRFLNVFLAAALVWLGFVAARMIFPERRCLRLGVPMLLAFFPQDTFYSIQSDVLSPLCFGVAFAALVRLLHTETPGARLAAVAGLALAATCLVKTSNLPLVAVSAAAVLFKARRLAKTGKLGGASLSLGLLVICVLLPIGIWLAWNQYTFGDFTGSAAKIKTLGWTRKPFSEWWHHPIFTARGLWIFWSELMASFWRGELVWFNQRLASPTVDVFYWISSTLLVALALISLLPGSVRATGLQRQALWFGFWGFSASVVFLILMSIAFDCGDCVYPSRAYPYFSSGRLLSGALIPFLLLYVFGLDRALCRAKSDRPLLFVLVGIVLVMTISEIIVNRPVFSSEYNWFHLLAGPA